MSERNMRGTSWLDSSQVGGYSLEDPDELRIAETGFRLARDGGFEHYRGKSFDITLGPPSSYGELPKALDHLLLGFRLTHDRENT